MTGRAGTSAYQAGNSVATVDRRAVLDIAYAIDNDWSFRTALAVRSIQIESPRADYVRWMDPEVSLSRALSTEPFTRLSASVFLPLAETDRRAGGVRLNDGLQPGRGSYGVRLEGYGSVEATEDLTVFASAGIRRELAENEYGYKFGRLLDASVGVVGVIDTVSLMLAATVVRSSTDEAFGIQVKDTGGMTCFLTPGIRIEPGSGVAFLLADQVSVWRDVEGQQMLPRHTVVAGLSFRF